MRLTGVVLFLLLSTVISCKEEKVPQGILSKAQIADWMIDIYLVEARTQVIPITRDSAYKLFLPYKDSLMRKKGLQDSTLRKSYQYYLEHPDELEAIYDVVIDSLNLMAQRLTPTSVVKP